MTEMDESANRPKTDKRKAPKSAFKPGQSGNPSGRPKEDPVIRAMLTDMFNEKCLPWAAERMDDEECPDAIKMRIFEAVAPYCLSKATELHEHSGPDGAPLPVLSREEVLRVLDDTGAAGRARQSPQNDA